MKAGQAHVDCVGCGDRYNRHEAGGGPCTVVDEDGVCPCRGFRWVPLLEDGGERVSYSSAPVSSRNRTSS